MGRRGPAPLPIAVKRLRGETHLSRLAVIEPIPRQGDPVEPHGLSDRAGQVWRQCLEDAPKGVVAPIDAPILRCYVEAVARYEDAAQALAASGPLLKSRRADGPGLVRNPLTQIVRDAADQERLFARELGFTPAARAGLRLDSASQAENVWSDVSAPRRLKVVGDGR